MVWGRGGGEVRGVVARRRPSDATARAIGETNGAAAEEEASDATSGEAGGAAAEEEASGAMSGKAGGATAGEEASDAMARANDWGSDAKSCTRNGSPVVVVDCAGRAVSQVGVVATARWRPSWQPRLGQSTRSPAWPLLALAQPPWSRS